MNLFVKIPQSQETFAEHFRGTFCGAGVYEMRFHVCLQSNPYNCVDNTIFVHVNNSGRMANPTTELAPLNVSIAPNPSKEVFNINFNQVLKGNVILEVFSLIGQKVYSENIENQKEHQLILHSLTPGAYILKITNNNQTISKKLIKN